MSIHFKNGIVYTQILCANNKLVDMGLDENVTDFWVDFCFDIKNLLAIKNTIDDGLATNKMFIYLRGMTDAYINFTYNTENLDVLWNYKKQFQ